MAPLGRETVAGWAGNSPATTAMAHAREQVTHTLVHTPPAGAVAETLEVVCQVWEHLDQTKLQILLRLAQIHTTGNLLEVGGQRTLAGWLTHTLGVSQNQARPLALLAQLLFEDKLPQMRKALDAGMLSVDEAAAAATACEQAVKTRDKTRFADADEFRAMMDAGIMAAKAENPALSGAGMARLGRQLAAEYNPSLAEDRHQKAFEARRVDLARTFEDSYYLQAWGPDADAELIDKALAAFTKPHDPNRPQVSKAERTYDGLMAMVKAALGHQGCTKPPGPLAMINITVPLDVFTGQREQSAPTTAQGPGKESDGSTQSRQSSDTAQGWQDESSARGGQNESSTQGGRDGGFAASQESDASTRGGQEESSARGGRGCGFAVTQDGQVIAMEAVRGMAPDSVLRRVITDPTTGKPLDVGRGQRNAPEQIRTVANHGHTTCAWEQGCDVPISDTEADHIRSYSRGGATSADNIQPLCSTHNRLKWRREANPHRAVWKGRPAHRPPDPPPDPEPEPPPVPPPDPDPPPDPPPDPMSQE